MYSFTCKNCEDSLFWTECGPRFKLPCIEPFPLYMLSLIIHVNTLGSTDCTRNNHTYNSRMLLKMCLILLGSSMSFHIANTWVLLYIVMVKTPFTSVVILEMISRKKKIVQTWSQWSIIFFAFAIKLVKEHVHNRFWQIFHKIVAVVCIMSLDLMHFT